ncbi:hypothetical protein DFP72DRAFT_844089 [Ephemerocybe angulata]|uniref:Uncharacterized protein n=1 Tax=Ephemerocybe angulata TaxID=980116 RepID=A0A8H6MDF6_9AGAR|nr:hypothetical protein DFP72DRAFT_1099272 [Tulosesus angulatus]KAF6759977.1 hypothetical protein DFP72DRAFT_844089 [Tulosesus angulatus]
MSRGVVVGREQDGVVAGGGGARHRLTKRKAVGLGGWGWRSARRRWTQIAVETRSRLRKLALERAVRKAANAKSAQLRIGGRQLGVTNARRREYTYSWPIKWDASRSDMRSVTFAGQDGLTDAREAGWELKAILTPVPIVGPPLPTRIPYVTLHLAMSATNKASSPQRNRTPRPTTSDALLDQKFTSPQAQGDGVAMPGVGEGVKAHILYRERRLQVRAHNLRHYETQQWANHTIPSRSSRLHSHSSGLARLDGGMDTTVRRWIPRNQHTTRDDDHTPLTSLQTLSIDLQTQHSVATCKIETPGPTISDTGLDAQLRAVSVADETCGCTRVSGTLTSGRAIATSAHTMFARDVLATWVEEVQVYSLRFASCPQALGPTATPIRAAARACACRTRATLPLIGDRDRRDFLLRDASVQMLEWGSRFRSRLGLLVAGMLGLG